MLPKSINCLSQSLPNSAFCWGAGYALIGASQQVQAQDGVDEVYYTKATTCTVPNGMNIVHLGEDGAGGGAGSSPYPPLRLGHGGARGAKGATVAGAVQISPGATLHLRAGMAGRPGANAMGVPTVGGVGGTGDGHRGSGGGGRHGGGGGGGNGGTYGVAPSTTHKAAAANWTPPAHGSQGGTTGDSCASASIEELSFVAEGNASGGINAEAAPNIPAAQGGLSLIFTFAADRTARISAIRETGATVQAPRTMLPGYEVGSYRVHAPARQVIARAEWHPGPQPRPVFRCHYPLHSPGPVKSVPPWSIA